MQRENKLSIKTLYAKRNEEGYIQTLELSNEELPPPLTTLIGVKLCLTEQIFDTDGTVAKNVLCNSEVFTTHKQFQKIIADLASEEAFVEEVRHLSSYTNIVKRFKKVIRLYNSSKYAKELVHTYFAQLGCGPASGSIYRRYGFDYDILDLLESPYKGSGGVIGSIAVMRHEGWAPCQKGEYTVPFVKGGKFNKMTKAYIPLTLFKNAKIEFYKGKDSTDIVKDNIVYSSENMAIALLDVLHAKADTLCNYGNRYVIPGTRAYQYSNSSFVVTSNVTHPTKEERGLQYCGMCTYLRDDYLEDSGCCASCKVDNLENVIMDYSTKPNPRYFRSIRGKIRGFSHTEAKFTKYSYKGFELEVECKSGVSSKMRDIIADEIMNIRSSDGYKLFYVKRDGSLDYGFEIVSFPMTYNAYRSINFSSIFGRFQKYLKSFNTDTAGMHLHVSRNSMSSLEAFKVLKMTYDYPHFTMLISQRSVDEQNEWANLRLSNLSRVKRAILSYWRDDNYNPTPYRSSVTKFIDATSNIKCVKGMGGDRGAWNFQNSATIECRIFKGNLNPTAFMKNVEYVESLIDYCKLTSMGSLSLGTYVGFVKSNTVKYPNLNKYLTDQRKSLAKSLSNPKQIPFGLER